MFVCGREGLGTRLTQSRWNCEFYDFAVLNFGRIPYYRAQHRSSKQLSTREPDPHKIVNLFSLFLS